MPLFLVSPEEQIPQTGAHRQRDTSLQNKRTSSSSPIRMTLYFTLSCYECIKCSQCDCPFEGEKSGASVPRLPRRGGWRDDWGVTYGNGGGGVGGWKYGLRVLSCKRTHWSRQTDSFRLWVWKKAKGLWTPWCLVVIISALKGVLFFL